MSRNVTVGLDGTPESRAAAEWAAREARLRGVPLTLGHAWEPVSEPLAQAALLEAGTWLGRSERGGTGTAPAADWGSIAREAAEGLRLRHPAVDVTVAHVSGRPADVLVDAAKDADLLVLGSRRTSGLAEFLVGSVGTAVIARTDTPVVLVRAGEQAADEHVEDPAGIPSAATAYRPVVLGVDTRSPGGAVLAFAFEEAARRGTALRAVHGWKLPSYFAYGLPAAPGLDAELGRRDAAALAEVLRPWREKYPDVPVTEESRAGGAAGHLVDAAGDASLVVVGRRIRRGRLGAHIGSVTHAVLHHATAPVAVVAHD
ncbi:universal stress protein [Streptomyces cinerochromogenes]|uniref:Universal stress protein n=1 Tax=Streptomyces cinerochromogenes TaxID=66422 RepID=A0ABW7BAB3_9ACTN